LPVTLDQPVEMETSRFHTLEDWLSWQQELHFSSIDLGLDRCKQVALDLNLLSPAYKVITVAGTNGKGSSAMMLERIFRKAGYRVGCYTSPHLVRYNERILVNGQEASDEMLCRSFNRIDRARGDITLTYFEFGTLAALDIFKDAALDIGILEVGLGGRLDAVNMIDADIAFLCTIDVDHTRWLGHDRDSIGFEKAGILRPFRPAVCSDSNPPASIREYAAALDTNLLIQGRDFHYETGADTWSWHSQGHLITNLPKPDLYNQKQIQNAAAVLKVVELLSNDFPVPDETIIEVMSGFKMPGRCQVVEGEVQIVLDVAHNPQAIENLLNCISKMPAVNSTHVVIGFLNDKDYKKMLQTVSDIGDFWYVVTLDDERKLDGSILEEELKNLGVNGKIGVFGKVGDAMKEVSNQSHPGDRIIITGSFLTVGGAISWLNRGN